MSILSLFVKDKINILRLVLCGLLSYILLFIKRCRVMKDSGKTVKFRPPGFVFDNINDAVNYLEEL